MSSDKARLKLRIFGHVQGVMFRASAADEARAMGVTGYARNLPDGSVEIVAEGRPEFLRMLAAWAVVGPPHARVDKVEEAWEPFVGDFEEFRVR